MLLFVDNKGVDQIVKWNDGQGKQDYKTTQPIGHFDGVARDETFEKTCGNGKGKRAQENFKTVFKSYFEGIHSGIGSRK